MTEPRYTPQMLVATTCVLFLPAGVVWLLHSRGVIGSFWLSLLVGLALTFMILTIGTVYWRQRRHPASVLFSELLIWGWIRHQYLDHKINAALHSLSDLHPGDTTHRTQLLTEIAAAVEAKDPFLYGHSRRVARYVMRVGRRMHLDRTDVARFRTAALLHDVGKLHTPPEILLQPRKLNPAETAMMRRHVEDGAEMVAALGDRSLAGVVRHHHERFDGTGYPTGLEGDVIPLGSRIIAVPDTFDAITTTRPYRQGLPHKAALTVLRNEAGTQFDPVVVHAFLAEYTDRRGAMIWAGAEQLIPVLRVAAVTVAAIAVSTVAFAASAPVAYTQTQGRATTQRGPARTPLRSGQVQPRLSRTPPQLRENTQRHSAVATNSGQLLQPPAGAAPATATPSRSQPPFAPLPASAVQRTIAPSAPPLSSAPSQSVAVTPQAVTAYSQLGGSLTNPHNLGALTTTQQTQPPPPTTTTIPTAPTAPPATTIPTAPTAPPASTTPAPPTEPTSPTPPSNPGQCKNGGWQTLGYKNQGQCIAAAKTG
jgi:putative nucleotidyltransferase with HDIG domain